MHAKKKTTSERTYNRQLAFKEHFHGALSNRFSFDQFSAERSLLFNGRRSNLAKLMPDLLYAEVSGNEAVIVSEKRQPDHDMVLHELGVRILQAYTIDDLIGVLVGLIGTDGRFRGLGIIEDIDFKERSIVIYTTVKDFGVLQFGSIKLDMRDFSYKGSFNPKIFKA